MSYKDNIFTIYDLMEKKGVFRINPANRDAYDKDTRQSLYRGPVQFPKMLYHPEGATRVTVPAEVISTPFGPQRVGEQRELVSKIVESPEEETVLKKLGWLDHPAKAIYAGLTEEQKAAGIGAPPISSEETIKSLEDQVKELLAQLEAAKGSVAVDDGHEAEANRALADAKNSPANALSGAKTSKVA